jgi:hypothetical protein
MFVGKKKTNKYVKGKNVQTKLNEGEMERKKACVEFINACLKYER